MRENDVIRYLAGLNDKQIGDLLSQARSVTNSRRVRDSIAEKLQQFAPMIGGAPEPLVSEPLVSAPRDDEPTDG